MSDNREASPGGSLRALGSSVLALLRVRLELVTVELKEESLRRKEMLILAVVAAYFLASGLLFVAFLVIVLFWDTYRLAAIGGVTFLYLGVGGWAFLRLRERVHGSPPPFAASIAEFERDLELLRGKDE